MKLIVAKKETNTAAQAKILRIGVIQAGKIVEERLIRKRESVTIGASARNTIVVPASTLPRSFTLFDMSRGQYALLFTENMDGRVALDDQPQPLSLAQVREKGLAHSKGGKGGLRRLQLTENARGKVLLGEVTLLFQFVAPPPVQPRPQLPPSVRGNIVSNVDWVLATCFAVLFTMNSVALLWMKTLPLPDKLAADVVPDDFARFVPTIEQPKKIDITKMTKVGEKKVEKVAEKKVVKTQAVVAKRPGKRKPEGGNKAPPCDAECQSKKADERRARLAKQVSRMGALALLGTKAKGTGGATRDLLTQGDPGTEATKAFKGVGGLSTSGSGRRGGLKGKGGGSGTGTGVGIGNLGGRVGGPATVGTGSALKEKSVKGIVKKIQATVDEGTMNTNAVGRVIRLGKGAIQACYQRALKRNPKLTGKISIRLIINAMGKVTKVSVDSDSVGDPSVTSCIKSIAGRWRFPPPEGGPAEVVVPIVFQSSGG